MTESKDQDAALWKEMLDLLDETLHGVLTLLRFEGANCTEKLRNMTKEDLWTIERLWEAHSFIMRVQGVSIGSKKEQHADSKKTETENTADTNKEHSATPAEEGEKLDEKDIPTVTEQTVEKAVEIYKESFIWLGLLPHWTK